MLLIGGAMRTAAISTLINTTKLNGVDSWARLAYALGSIADHPARRIAACCPGTENPHRVLLLGA